MKEEIRLALLQFKNELEAKFNFASSKLNELNTAMFGTVGIYLEFESKFSLSIHFWESGVINIVCLYSKKKYWSLFEETKEMMVYDYTPQDHQNNKYPQESFDILLEKLEELKKRIEKIYPDLK